jgi:nucleoside-diphosphate-sugar epimerase
VRHLLAAGVDVRVLVHPQHNNRGVEGLAVERVEGDLRDADAVRRAVAGCVRVYHTGAKVSVNSPTPAQTREIWEVNVMGTQNVMQAALRAGVARVCLTSSFSTVGYHADDPSRACAEDLPFFPFIDWMPYSRTKVLAEVEAFKAIADGLDVVIAISTGVCGPNDFLPSRTGNVLRSASPAASSARTSPAATRRSASTTSPAATCWRWSAASTGQRYTISHPLRDDGRDARPVRRGHRQAAQGPGAAAAADVGVARALVGPMTAFFPDVPQQLTPGAVLVLSMQRRADITKAREQLGYQPGAIEPVVRAWYEFFVREQMI